MPPHILRRIRIQKLTKKELSKYNGEGGPDYIAFQGKIYDVSSSFLWQQGKHRLVHKTGQDLTEALKEAPHSEELLKKFPIVGELEDN